jgi:hypothetical protein
MTTHPVEIARKALIEAALIETGEWSDLYRRLALSLPRRAPLPELAERPLPKLAVLRPRESS